jgi:hypothetical protein
MDIRALIEERKKGRKGARRNVISDTPLRQDVGGYRRVNLLFILGKEAGAMP